MISDITLVSDVVRRSAGTWPERIAVQTADGECRLTYAELRDHVERGASRLLALGLEPGARVLLTAEPSPYWIASFLAIAHAGLIAVPIPSNTSAALVQLVAVHAKVRVCIADHAGSRLASALTGLRFIAAADLTAPGVEPVARASTRPAEKTAVLVFTSGSTARPRAVRLSHAALRANLRSLQEMRHAEPGETLLSTLPPSHAYELVAGQLAPLSAGARVVYAGALLPNRLVETMRTQAVTRMILVPALLQAIVREVVGTLADRGVLDQSCPSMTARELAAAVRALDASERARINAAIRDIIGPAFHVVTLGGAASDPAWTDVLAFAGVDLDVGYGLTEAGPVVAMGRAADCPAGSVGRPLPGVNVRIGTDDEILVQSPAAMTGYAADDRATAEAFADGWLRTGDRGRIDSDGFLFISGRIKEAMVTSAGETIYPDEIEPFYASPLFAEFAVVPVQAADGNDEPTLVIVPADSTPTDVLRREVATLRAAAPARLRIAGFAHRRDALPRSAAGKIRRRALADDIRLQERLS